MSSDFVVLVLNRTQMSVRCCAGRVRVMVSHTAKGGFNNRSLSAPDQLERQTSDTLQMDVVNGDLLTRGKLCAHSTCYSCSANSYNNLEHIINSILQL